MRDVFFIVLLATTCKYSSGASYESCRLVKGALPIYHRRLQQQPTTTLKVQYINYPETFIDRSPANAQVITCIRCRDLNVAFPRDSECKVIAGGCGHRYVKIKIFSFPNKGYNYDLLIYGEPLYR